jgi:lambda family phage portal protein
MKKQLPPPNFVERALAVFAPQAAGNRYKSRISAFTGGGGYSGAGYQERLSYFQPGIGDSDADSLRDLRELRARSRDLVRNSAIAGGAIETQVTNVVGSGLRLISRIDADKLGLDPEAAEEWQDNAEREFCLWAESEYADAFGQQTWAELQDLAFRSHLESGDVGVVLASIKRQDWPFTLAVQIIEADRISNPGWVADTDQMTAGIEMDENHSPVAVNICNRHPGRYISPTDFKWTRIPYRGKSGRRNFMLLLRKLRPGQTRGIPALAPIIETLKQLDRYSMAEVDAAVNSAAFALFVKMDPDTFTDTFDDTAQQAYIDSAKRWDGTIKSGAAINLLPGEEVNSPSVGRPNPNFDPFVNAVLTQIGMALNIPKEVLTKHFQSSYSAARAALLDAWRTFKIRREWLAGRFCQPIYEEWLADAVSTGRISAPGFFADPAIRKAWSGAQWSGDGPGAIDPLKEVQAAEARVNMGLTTLAEEISAYDGGDWDDKHRESVRITDERIEDGLQAPNAPPPGTPGMPGMPSAPAKAPSKAPAKAPADDGGDNETDDQVDAMRGLRRAQAIRAGN